MAKLTEAQIADFERDGFIIVRGLYDSEEIDLLHRAALADKALDQKPYVRANGEGVRIGRTLII